MHLKLAMWPLVFALCAVPAHAKLPQPSPEQQAAAAQKKAEEAQKAREQQQALTKVQDRLASRFGRGHTAAGQTETGNLSQKTVEPKGDAGPNGGREQSAEAHSTPAR